MGSINNHCVTANIRQFILGGKSEFTVLNTVNGIEYKYHIKSNKEHDTWFVNVKIAGSFKYAGFIKRNQHNGLYQYARGKKGSMDASNVAIKGLFWVLNHADNMNPAVKVIHHGKCACCGKALTDEQSIVRGIGPVCYDRVMRRGI